MLDPFGEICCRNKQNIEMKLGNDDWRRCNTKINSILVVETILKKDTFCFYICTKHDVVYIDIA